MKSFVLIVALLAFSTTLVFGAGTQCQPQCKWQCDDPVCHAVCHPVCEKPDCRNRCEEEDLPPMDFCAKCDIECGLPACSIRCPSHMAEVDCKKNDNCPDCQIVCEEPECKSMCIPPALNCKPECKPLDCQHKCHKPSVCARPKCELVCEKSKCAAEEDEEECCECDSAALIESMSTASTAAGSHASSLELPSFVEVLHSAKFHTQNGAKQCCRCASKDAIANL